MIFFIIFAILLGLIELFWLLLVKVCEFGSRIEAEMAQSLLYESGIESFVKGDDCGGFYTSQSFSIGVSVYVLEADYHEAVSLLADPAGISDSTLNRPETDNDEIINIETE